MGQYLSPGVYVEEVPSAVKAIAGVSTSTAGFIGVVPASITVPKSSVKVVNELIGKGDGTNTTFDLANYPVVTDTGKFEIRVDGVRDDAVTLSNDDVNKRSTVTFTPAPADKAVISADYTGKYAAETFAATVANGTAKLCTNFGDFCKYFGGFSTDAKHNKLAHAAYGFFNNGGTRCYVAPVTDDTDTNQLDAALAALGTVDEVALVAAPGLTSDDVRDRLVTHCQTTGDRFAILDGPSTATDLDTLTKIAASGGVMPKITDYAAWYFPWMKVTDPATKTGNQLGDSVIEVPPSGHMAGIYARVDTQRGVHKAPANEAVRGVLNVTQPLSKAHQNGLNPKGVNCIRVLNDNILVWGARTVGGDANADLKYINVRRTLLFIRESIDEGTQWVVFEPNTPELWQKITRNVTAFLTNVWRSGALFGTSAAEAFYVKCDAETNPPELRELGQVVTEIGVAIVRPAEFVIFRISQWQPTK